MSTELLDQMDDTERAFSLAITDWLERVPESHQVMARAGLTLLAAACDAYPDDDQEMALYRAGYAAGLKEGTTLAAEGFLALLKATKEQRAAIFRRAAETAPVAEPRMAAEGSMTEKEQLPPVQIGTIDGLPVMADLWYGGDDQLEIAEVVYISTTWMDREFSTDGRAWVNLPHGGDLAGDTSLAEFGWIKEAVSAGVIDKLVLLAQQVVDKPLAA